MYTHDNVRGLWTNKIVGNILGIELFAYMAGVHRVVGSQQHSWTYYEKWMYLRKVQWWFYEYKYRNGYNKCGGSDEWLRCEDGE